MTCATLSCTVLRNTTYELGTDRIDIATSQSLLKDYTLPTNLSTGEYFLTVQADYLVWSSQRQNVFSVTQVFYKYALFGVLPIWILAAVIFALSSGTFGVVFYKKRQASKKRYHIQLDYNALPQDGPRSAWAGLIAETKKRVYFDIDLFQVHTLVAGSSGGGKTVAAKVLAEEALMHGAAVICFDPTAQWSGFLRKGDDKKMFDLYAKFGMKPAEARGFSGNIRQLLDPREYIDLVKFIKPGEITVFAINKLDPSDIDIIVENTVKEVFNAHLPESKQLRLVLIFDEVHRLLPKFGGSGRGFLQIERAAREFRKWGVGLVLISQVLTDFAASIKANINTEIQMRTRDERDLSRIQESYGPDIFTFTGKSCHWYWDG